MLLLLHAQQDPGASVPGGPDRGGVRAGTGAVRRGLADARCACPGEGPRPREGELGQAAGIANPQEGLGLFLSISFAA